MVISPVTKAAVLQQLAKIIDPEIGQSIVGLGLVYGVAIGENTKLLTITFTMTSLACPLEDHFRQQITKTLTNNFAGWSVKVDITFDPPWSTAKISQDVKTQLALLGMPIK